MSIEEFHVEAGDVAEDAGRLLGAFHDASGGSLTSPIPLGGSGAAEGAARGAGFDPGSARCDTALRYLLNQGCLKDAGSGAYTITVAGMDRARELRGLDTGNPDEGRNEMSEKAQRRLVTLLAIGIAMGLSQPVSNFIHEQIPEQRGIKDDLTEAVLEGIVRTAAFFLASLAVRQLAGRK